MGGGNGNPLQCSCLENPRDGGAWWAAVYGVAQSQTRLKRLSSSSSSSSRGWVLRLGQDEAKLPDLAKPCFWRLEERTWQGLPRQQSPAALPVYCPGDGRVMGLTTLVLKHQDSRTVSMSKKGKEVLDPCQLMDHTGLENRYLDSNLMDQGLAALLQILWTL